MISDGDDSSDHLSGSPTHHSHMGHHSDDYEIREQDRLLPIANIARIMKCALPDNAKIAKDAKETIQECVSEFILFISSEACDRCQQEKRKTINGDDLLWAMQTLGLDNYLEPLRVYLGRYREFMKVDKMPALHQHHTGMGGGYPGAGGGPGGMGGGGAFTMGPQ